MPSSSSSSSSFTMSFLSFFFFFSLALISIAKASVPPSETFKYVNEGEFGPYINEYDADYRVLDPFSSPFQLCFYNTTPNAYTLALRMGIQRTEPLYRWVWEANRGKPVRENATLTLGTNGNLVLAEADGTVVWQTNTANKGVVGFKLLSNGNMVLRDSKGNFIWQSFDYPTDTLLVGQSLRVGGVTKLVSRKSAKENVDGAYSFVLEPKQWAMYHKINNSPRPVLYYSSPIQPTDYLKFIGTPDTDEGFAYDLSLENSNGGSSLFARPKYNGTASFLRLGMDGNLVIYTYYDKVSWGAYEKTFSLFDRDSIWETECQLPERCGKLGLCEDNQCVACPSEKGLLGWSKSCEAKKLTSCAAKDFHYYKVEGVDHYMSKYTRGSGPAKVEDCGKKCTSDCKCLGYFYNQDTSRCWIAYDLMTLTKVSNSTHLGFIKVPNK
ncbi:hypothetical protein LWI28_016512 [Acer negundo]|uniref:Bulb-type lectin domain-containing protein n=1 Tax=Acer negundo TaxID=4023 RepID=A0AAD5J6D1_ACENE|nr:hypothetical protein LWI28_016512 [Acer negundo]KAK4850096.1 hypothetical protein QYF36_003832 [Acer negundo]